MEQIVYKAVQRIKREAPRSQHALKKLCDETEAKLLPSQEERLASPRGSNAAPYFGLLKAACATKSARVAEVALDYIQKLVAYGYLPGNELVGEPDAPNGGAAAPQGPDAAAADAEGGSATAAGAQDGAYLKDADTDRPGASESPRRLVDDVVEAVCECAAVSEDGVQLQVLKALLTLVTSNVCLVREASLLAAIRACYHVYLVNAGQKHIRTTAKAGLMQIVGMVFQRMEGRAMEQLAERQYSGAAEGRAPAAAAAAPATPVTPDAASSAAEGDASGGGFASAEHRDAFLVFRALCKLSNRGLSIDAVDYGASASASFLGTDVVSLASKELALELLLVVLKACGDAFRSDGRFVYAVRNYLCASLLQNCTSQVTSVVGLSLRIFVLVLESFKDRLKAEIELFVTNIFVRILDSENSTVEHKQLVLEVFRALCGDKGRLMELFINYDCDMNERDLFREVTVALAKVGKQASGPEDKGLTLLSLEGLNSILVSLQETLEDQRALEAPAETPPRGADGVEDVDVDGGAAGAVAEQPGDGSGASSPRPNAIMEMYKKKQRAQEVLTRGFLRFNLKPTAGVQYLQDMKAVGEAPRDVAAFLLQHGSGAQSRLDKTAIGDYLGRDPEYADGYCLRVLHAYVDLFDFAEMPIDEAIRRFLSGFRLPGEAQKIDRMMEKFAERYCAQNAAVFPSADTAFILAFSIIMLNTDLHNPNLKPEKRMKVEDFIRNNRGISAGGADLDPAFLADIYGRIAGDEITLAEDDAQRIRFETRAASSSFFLSQTEMDRRKSQAFKRERAHMLKTTQAAFSAADKPKKSRGPEEGGGPPTPQTPAPSATPATPADADGAARRAYRSASTVANRAEHVAPMFEVAWAPLTAVYSHVLERESDADVLRIALRGLECAVTVAGRTGHATARVALVEGLASFTALASSRGAIAPKAVMDERNLLCLDALLRIAVSQGETLGSSWLPVLRCVSRVAALHLHANAADKDFAAADRGAAAGAPEQDEQAQALRARNAALVTTRVDPLLLDRIFVYSERLSSRCLRFFVQSLCAVSVEEISLPLRTVAGSPSPLGAGALAGAPAVPPLGGKGRRPSAKGTAGSRSARSAPSRRCARRSAAAAASRSSSCCSAGSACAAASGRTRGCSACRSSWRWRATTWTSGRGSSGRRCGTCSGGTSRPSAPARTGGSRSSRWTACGS